MNTESQGASCILLVSNIKMIFSQIQEHLHTKKLTTGPVAHSRIFRKIKKLF